MTPDRALLEIADCWFSADRVPNDPQTTQFKREARYRQSVWRDNKQLPKGTHPNSKNRIAMGEAVEIPNGSRLDPSAADPLANFLSRSVQTAVEDRLAHRQPGETLNVRRLRTDLLSSMPMCFNLFGELHADDSRARGAAEFFLPEATAGPVQVMFEWSPQRQSLRYTNDSTAFDAALLVGPSGLPRQVVGIETKYHEHALRDPAPKPHQKVRYEAQTAHLVGIARASGRFRAGWEDEVLTTELRQIWRDHVLLLSMLQHESEWAGGRYVLVHPQRNTSFARAVERYRQVLQEGDDSCGVTTIEDLLAADFLHDETTASKFASRYIW